MNSGPLKIITFLSLILAVSLAVVSYSGALCLSFNGNPNEPDGSGKLVNPKLPVKIIGDN